MQAAVTNMGPGGQDCAVVATTPRKGVMTVRRVPGPQGLKSGESEVWGGQDQHLTSQSGECGFQPQHLRPGEVNSFVT